MRSHNRRTLQRRYIRPQYWSYFSGSSGRRQYRKIIDGDIIDIDIPNRSINVRLTDNELASRQQRPLTRKRVISKALKAYANSVSSADKGGVRIIE